MEISNKFLKNALEELDGFEFSASTSVEAKSLYLISLVQGLEKKDTGAALSARDRILQRVKNVDAVLSRLLKAIGDFAEQRAAPLNAQELSFKKFLILHPQYLKQYRELLRQQQVMLERGDMDRLSSELHGLIAEESKILKSLTKLSKSLPSEDRAVVARYRKKIENKVERHNNNVFLAKNPYSWAVGGFIGLVVIAVLIMIIIGLLRLF